MTRKTHGDGRPMPVARALTVNRVGLPCVKFFSGAPLGTELSRSWRLGVGVKQLTQSPGRIEHFSTVQAQLSSGQESLPSHCTQGA
jgi:hypothetical protein